MITRARRATTEPRTRRALWFQMRLFVMTRQACAQRAPRQARARRAACFEKLYWLLWGTRTHTASHCLHIMAVYSCLPDILLLWWARARRATTEARTRRALWFQMRLFVMTRQARAQRAPRQARARRAACFEKLYWLLWGTRTHTASQCLHIMGVYSCLPDFLLLWWARARRATTEARTRRALWFQMRLFVMTRQARLVRRAPSARLVRRAPGAQPVLKNTIGCSEALGHTLHHMPSHNGCV